MYCDVSAIDLYLYELKEECSQKIRSSSFWWTLREFLGFKHKTWLITSQISV